MPALAGTCLLGVYRLSFTLIIHYVGATHNACASRHNAAWAYAPNRGVGGKLIIQTLCGSNAWKRNAGMAYDQRKACDGIIKAWRIIADGAQRAAA